MILNNKKLSFGKLSDGRLATLRHSDQFIYSLILFSSIISLLASFILSKHAVELAANKNAVFSCDINSVISCGTVAQSWQASAFGFPNAFIGLMFEPIICLTAILGLLGVKIPSKLMILINFVYGFALAFALWLFFESITVIHALCPYCLLVTLGTGMVFISLLHLNFRDNIFHLPSKVHDRVNSFLYYYGDVLITVIYLSLIIVVVLAKYGRYIF